MKKIIAILVLLPLFSKSQNIVISGNPIQKDSVVVLDTTLKKDQLYTKGLEWFATTYKNAQKVIQLQDKEAGLIVGKASMSCIVKGGALLPATETYLSYTIKLSFKDGKIKYELNEFIQDVYGVIKDGEVIKSSARGIVKNQYSGLKKGVYNEIAMIEKSILETFTKMKNTNW
jgi:Domain of unknown function (DUF4468) with TBP-like fold